MSRRAWAVIDLAALHHNLQKVREYAPDTRVMAVIKANAYGHGVLPVARALNDADALAVASYTEAAALREAGIGLPILLLGGVMDVDELYSAVERDMTVVVHDFHQMELIEKSSCAASINLWIKIDSGMHRLGFDPADLPELRRRLTALPKLHVSGWMTHLASAEDINDPSTAAQISRFSAALAGAKGQRSIANSAGIIAWPQSHADWVRPGIMLYGASPIDGRSAEELGLRPVMTLCSSILSIRKLEKGERVGYGGTWTAPEPMRMGVIAVGYGDGYPRHAPSGTPVLVSGLRAALIGRVSMDMICVDLRNCDDVCEGDTVVLWGEGLAADEVAKSAGTIAYELFCRLTRRVEFEYKN